MFILLSCIFSICTCYILYRYKYAVLTLLLNINYFYKMQTRKPDSFYKKTELLFKNYNEKYFYLEEHCVVENGKEHNVIFISDKKNDIREDIEFFRKNMEILFEKRNLIVYCGISTVFDVNQQGTSTVFDVNRQGTSTVFDVNQQGTSTVFDVNQQGTSTVFDVNRQGTSTVFDVNQQGTSTVFDVNRQGTSTVFDVNRQGTSTVFDVNRQGIRECDNVEEDITSDFRSFMYYFNKDDFKLDVFFSYLNIDVNSNFIIYKNDNNFTEKQFLVKDILDKTFKEILS